MVKRKNKLFNTVYKSEEQRVARVRNWCLFRLNGVIATLQGVDNDLSTIGSKVGSADFSCSRSDIKRIIENVKNEV